MKPNWDFAGFICGLIIKLARLEIKTSKKKICRNNIKLTITMFDPDWA